MMVISFFPPLSLRLIWTLLARKYWRYFNENNCSLSEEFTQFRPATARGKVVKNVSPESTKASVSPEALPHVALALHIHWVLVCRGSHCVPVLVVSLCFRVWSHRVKSSLMRVKHKAKSRSEGGRDETTAFPLSSSRWKLGTNVSQTLQRHCELWASFLWHKAAAAVTVAAELFTAPELSVSLGSEGGGNAAALSSCRRSWLCLSPQTEGKCFHFAHVSDTKASLVLRFCIAFMISELRTENVHPMPEEVAWLEVKNSNFFTSTAQCESWPAPFLPCNGVILQQIGREFRSLFPFGIHLLSYPVSYLYPGEFASHMGK